MWFAGPAGSQSLGAAHADPSLCLIMVCKQLAASCPQQSIREQTTQTLTAVNQEQLCGGDILSQRYSMPLILDLVHSSIEGGRLMRI